MDLDFKKVLLTQLVGRFYRDIYFSAYSPLQVQNSPRQSLPESSWVRVRNRLAGISGKDLHQLYGTSDIRVATAAGPDRRRFYPGHEVVGEVIEIGDDVRHLNVGDRVVLQHMPNCLTAGMQPLCHSCAADNFNLCEQGAFLAEQPLGGGWSEEMLLHEQQLYRVPETLTDEQAVMLEPASIAMHAILRHLPQPADRVLIIGAGTVGLLTQQIVSTLIPRAEISVLARYPFQVEQATRQGATHIIYPHDSYTGVQHATNARLYHGLFGNQTLLGGYDVIYDTIGQRKTLHHALRWTRSSGAVILVGLNSRMMDIDLTPLWNQEISLLGSTTHGVESWPLDTRERRSTFDVVTELIERGRINPEQLISHHFALNNYKNALLAATNKAESRAVKVVFDYSLLPASVVPNVRASAPRIRRQSTIDFNAGSNSGHLPASTSGRVPAQAASGASGTGAQRTMQPRNQTGTVGTRYTQPVQDVDDDDTAGALPAIRRRMAMRDGRPYTAVPSSQPTSATSAIPRPPEHTRETYPTPANLPVTPLPPETPDSEVPDSPEPGPLKTVNELDELDERTQRVSREEVLKQLASAKAPITPIMKDEAPAAPILVEEELGESKPSAINDAHSQQEPQEPREPEELATSDDLVEEGDPFYTEDEERIPFDLDQDVDNNATSYVDMPYLEEEQTPFDNDPDSDSYTPGVDEEGFPIPDEVAYDDSPGTSTDHTSSRPVNVRPQQSRSRNRKKKGGR